MNRPCIFKEFAGKVCWTTKTGTLIAWGVDFEQFDGGVGNFTVGIVEMENGVVQSVPAARITFTDKTLSPCPHYSINGCCEPVNRRCGAEPCLMPPNPVEQEGNL